MPTYERLPQFIADYAGLTKEQRELVKAVLQGFIQDADSGQFRARLRVHPMHGGQGVWEMTWEGNDGRATFSYGPEKVPGKRHIIWRRIGKHEIFGNP